MCHYFTMNCIWFMLFLHDLKQVLVLVKQLTSAYQQKRFYQADTTHMVHHFPNLLFANGGV